MSGTLGRLAIKAFSKGPASLPCSRISHSQLQPHTLKGTQKSLLLRNGGEYPLGRHQGTFF